METAWFEIQLAIPIEMTTSLKRDLVATVQPRWRIDNIDMRKLEDGLFALRLTFPASELSAQGNERDILRRFRDLVTSLIAF